MPQETIDLFQPSISKTTDILIEIEKRLNISNERRRAYQILRVVLHAVRDRLPVNEATDLAAQLPLLVKAVYYDGWSPASKPVKMNKEGFLDRIDGELGVLDFSAEEAVKAVLGALNKYISKGELEDIKAIWPADLDEIFK